MTDEAFTGPDHRPADTDGIAKPGCTAATIRDRWRAGEPPNLAALLAEQPELKEYRSTVLELAYEEYRLRLRTGETLDVAEYARRFPSLERSLFLFIDVRSRMSRDSETEKQQEALAWPEPGNHFLGFDLLAEIGRGAFGRVFLASERALGGRPVVLKVALQGGQEAKMLARLRHPNIVPVYSIRQDPTTGLTAFCMPYFGHATLSLVLNAVFAHRRAPSQARPICDAIRAANAGVESSEPVGLPRILLAGSYVEGVIHLAAEIADALAHAHHCGICHRDLKPCNILLSPAGRPLLLDFNLAIEDDRPVRHIGGTLPYMAPEELTRICEQAAEELSSRSGRGAWVEELPSPSGRGAGTDELSSPSGRVAGADELPSPFGRGAGGESALAHSYHPSSDLFSLGVIIYELLTGSLPFGTVAYDAPLKKTAGLLRRRQAQGPPSIRQQNKQVGKRLARLIESCLALEVERRPKDAAALAAALRKELAFPQRIRRWAIAHRWRVMTASAILAVALLGVVAYFAFRPPYSVRQFQSGMAYSAAGRDDLAIQCLTVSLHADPGRSEAFVARARAHQRLGDFRMACDDYQAARQLAPSPALDACLGYCMGRLGQHGKAIAFYRAALEAGCDSAAVLNDLGHSLIQLARFDEAEGFLRRAIGRDDSPQAAYHNLALVFLNRAMISGETPPEALACAARTVEIGPQSAELCRDMATLQVLAANRDPAVRRSAIDYVGKAIALGMDAKVFRSDPAFQLLHEDPAFQKALAGSKSASAAVKAEYMVAP